MKIAYSIHELVLKGERVSPNSVIELSDKTFAELDALGAVREATADEAAIAGLISDDTAKSAPAETVKKTPAATKKAEKKAAESKAEEPNSDPDPDVTEGGEADLLGGN